MLPLRTIVLWGYQIKIARLLTERGITWGSLEMKKPFAAAFVAVATIAGSFAATPVSAQRGVTAGVPASGHWPAPYEAGRGPYDDFGSCEWVNQRFWDGHGWRVRRVRVCG
jgi:hypothetical protein